jgi:hypothetical protein
MRRLRPARTASPTPTTIQTNKSKPAPCLRFLPFPHSFSLRRPRSGLAPFVGALLVYSELRRAAPVLSVAQPLLAVCLEFTPMAPQAGSKPPNLPTIAFLTAMPQTSTRRLPHASNHPNEQINAGPVYSSSSIRAHKPKFPNYQSTMQKRSRSRAWWQVIDSGQDRPHRYVDLHFRTVWSAFSPPQGDLRVLACV